MHHLFPHIEGNEKKFVVVSTTSAARLPKPLTRSIDARDTNFTDVQYRKQTYGTPERRHRFYGTAL